MENDVRVWFYLKRADANDDGLCPVMGRIMVGKTKEPFYAKLMADPAVWNTTAGRAVGKSKRAVEVNKVLDRTNVLVHTRFMELQARHEAVTALQVKEAVQGLLTGEEFLIYYTVAYNKSFDERKDRADSTKEQNRYALKRLQTFMQRRYRLTDIAFRGLTPAFIEEFDQHLRFDRKLSPGTIFEITRHLRMTVGLAIEQGIIWDDPFAGYDPMCPEYEPKSIPLPELEKMMFVRLDDTELCLARDMFIFESFTGLCYVDTFNLPETSLARDMEGLFWIKTHRQKTGRACNIPLLDVPLEIIEKYREMAPEGKLLPMPEYDRYRTQLKKVAKLCGIERNITSHLARHTYATEITLSNGVPMESIKEMLGHGSILSTERYSRVTNEKINADMSALEIRIAGKYQFAL